MGEGCCCCFFFLVGARWCESGDDYGFGIYLIKNIRRDENWGGGDVVMEKLRMLCVGLKRYVFFIT